MSFILFYIALFIILISVISWSAFNYWNPDISKLFKSERIKKFLYDRHWFIHNKKRLKSKNLFLVFSNNITDYLRELAEEAENPEIQSYFSDAKKAFEIIEINGTEFMFFNHCLLQNNEDLQSMRLSLHLRNLIKVRNDLSIDGIIYFPNQNAFAKELASYNNEVAKQGNGDYQRSFISEGFRSMTQIRDNSEPAVMEMKYDKGVWSALLVRPLKSEHLSLQGSFPVAFALWDGEKKNRDGSKLLSPWIGVTLDSNAKALALLDEIKGDVSNGEKLMMENCSACHQYKAVKNAPKYMAPNLSNIGGYSNASYLKESIMEPSAVVVAGYNVNAHKNFSWYTSDDKGMRTSTMPPFAHLDDVSVNDLVAFMRTLKVEVEK